MEVIKMEWLKELLEKAKITDGKLNVDEVMEAAKKEFPKHAVPKNVFNDKCEELKTANATITTLKKENGDNEELQNKIKDYETEIGNLKTAAINATKQYALKEQLTKSGVLDPDYLIYKAGGIDKFTFDKDNNPIGVDESIKAYREDKTMAHLFKQKAGYEPSKGGSPTKNPFAKETFNLTEQGKLLKENPAQAKEMAAAAGITI
jgi:hypothetical protein